MRLIEKWQFQFIEKSLYNYYKLQTSILPTNQDMLQAIDAAILFFTGCPHNIMIHEFYFKANRLKQEGQKKGYYKSVCNNILHTEPSNGFIIRREIIYRIAMNCFASGLFKR